MLEDTQNKHDNRGIKIKKVGVKDIIRPILFHDFDSSKPISTVGHFSLFAELAPELKGTHMSRFLEVLDFLPSPVTWTELTAMATLLTEKLQSQKAFLELKFPYFYEMTAPISRVVSTNTAQVSFEVSSNGVISESKLSVAVGVKTLCPCSKAISKYGAHSQRTIVTLSVNSPKLSCLAYVRMAENASSSPLYPILKREDEKFVTEFAYDNPRFAEDLVREAAISLKSSNHSVFDVQAESLESIHSHNVWANVSSEDLS